MTGETKVQDLGQQAAFLHGHAADALAALIESLPGEERSGIVIGLLAAITMELDAGEVISAYMAAREAIRAQQKQTPKADEG